MRTYTCCSEVTTIDISLHHILLTIAEEKGKLTEGKKRRLHHRSSIVITITIVTETVDPEGVAPIPCSDVASCSWIATGHFVLHVPPPAATAPAATSFKCISLPPRALHKPVTTALEHSNRPSKRLNGISFSYYKKENKKRSPRMMGRHNYCYSHISQSSQKQWSRPICQRKTTLAPWVWGNFLYQYK